MSHSALLERGIDRRGGPRNVLDIPAQPAVSKSRGRVLVWLTLALILAAGLCVRMYQLGVSNFWSDELYHVFAAKSLIETGSPTLPGGYEYTRALPFTYLIAGMFRTFGVSETAARMPAVVFGVAVIVFGFWMTRRWFGTGAAIAAALLIAFAPLCVKMSRECRMYTLVQLLYTVFAYLAFRLFEGGYAGSRLKQTGLAFGAVAIFCISLVLHKLVIFFVPAFFAYIALMFLAARGEEKLGPFSSKYSAILIVTLALAVIGAVLKPGIITKMAAEAFSVPLHSWAVSRVLFYKWTMEDLYPVLFTLYPLAAVYACWKYGRRGAFVVCLFAVPFLLKTFVFLRKEERYILFDLTFFYIALAPAIAATAATVAKCMKQAWASRGRVRRFAISGSLACLGIAVLVPTAHPWALTSVDYVRREVRPAWGRAHELFGGRIAAGNPVVVSHSKEARFYGFREPIFSANHIQSGSDAPRPGRVLPLYNRKQFVEMLSSPADIAKLRSHYEGRDLWFLLKRIDFDDPMSVPAAVRIFLLREAIWYGQNGSAATFETAGASPNDILVCRLSHVARNAVANEGVNETV
ncbi:MAG: glycosyltransferase family 39 protein [Candidatus Omnitrophota bacterium]|nr:glycosyltransferase family 39 protein [Candidatus Omnitrophota bacterium]